MAHAQCSACSTVLRNCACAQKITGIVYGAPCAVHRNGCHTDGGKAVTSERSLYKEICELKILNA